MPGSQRSILSRVFVAAFKPLDQRLSRNPDRAAAAVFAAQIKRLKLAAFD